jgi:hypothetical protein
LRLQLNIASTNVNTAVVHMAKYLLNELWKGFADLMEISSVNFIHLSDLTMSSGEKCNYYIGPLA